MKVLITLDLSRYDRAELIWMMRHGLLSVTEVRAELVNRGESEWKVLCKLREAC